MELKSFSLLDIRQIQAGWKRLERGDDMTYFQSYSWYEMLADVYSKGHSNLEIFFVVVYKDKQPQLIAPVIIYRKTRRLINRKGVYFFGRKGWSDYLNLIYDEFDEACAAFLIQSLKDKFGIVNFYFEQLKENTQFYYYLKNNDMLTKKDSIECVGLNLPESIDDYHRLLSKHSRQNIRTAQNRLSKDGMSLKINYDDHEVDLESCKRMRESRVVKKQKKIFKNKSIIKKIVSFVQRMLSDDRDYPSFLPFNADKKSKILTAYDGDNLCAFFNYGVDDVHKTIILMAVGTNEKYSRYSPGLLALYSLICHEIEKGTIRYFDFTRGDEPYKFALGGSNNVVYSVRLNLID